MLHRISHGKQSPVICQAYFTFLLVCMEGRKIRVVGVEEEVLWYFISFLLEKSANTFEQGRKGAEGKEVLKSKLKVIEKQLGL